MPVTWLTLEFFFKCSNSLYVVCLQYSKSEMEQTSSLASEEAGNCAGVASVEELIDWNKLACLLCRRAFPSRDILVKHQQMSELHKVNLALLEMLTMYCSPFVCIIGEFILSGDGPSLLTSVRISNSPVRCDESRVRRHMMATLWTADVMCCTRLG